jgi:hypothetical protein
MFVAVALLAPRFSSAAESSLGGTPAHASRVPPGSRDGPWKLSDEEALAQFKLALTRTPTADLGKALHLCPRLRGTGTTGLANALTFDRDRTLSPPAPGADGGPLNLEEFIVKHVLPANAEAVSLIACLVENDAYLVGTKQVPEPPPPQPAGDGDSGARRRTTPVPNTSGAAFLYAAAAKKHMRTLTALLRRSVSPSFRAPPGLLGDGGLGGSTVLHAALSTKLLVLDILKNLLSVPPPGAVAAAAAAAATAADASTAHRKPTPQPTGNATLAFPRWLASIVSSVIRHLPANEGARVESAFLALFNTEGVGSAVRATTTTSSKGGPGASSAADIAVDVELTPAAAELVARGAPLPAPLRTVHAGHVATLANGLATLLLRLLLDGPLGEGNAEGRAVLMAPDNAGRTPLHVAAMAGNFVGARYLLQRAAAAVAHDAREARGRGRRGRGGEKGDEVPSDGVEADAAAGVALLGFVSAQDLGGRTAADLACIYGHGRVAEEIASVVDRTEAHVRSLGGGGSSGGGPPSHTPSGSNLVLSPPPFVDFEGDGEGLHACAALTRAKWERWDAGGMSGATAAARAAAGAGGWNETRAAVPHAARDALAAARGLWRRRKLAPSTDQVPAPLAAAEGDGAAAAAAAASLSDDPPLCDVDIVDGADMTPRLFFERYYARNRPVLIRGAALALPQRDSWTREALVRRHGKTPFLATSIPYAAAFGIGKGVGGQGPAAVNNASGSGGKGGAPAASSAAAAAVGADGPLARTAAVVGAGDASRPSLQIRIEDYVEALFACAPLQDDAVEEGEWSTGSKIDAALKERCAALGFVGESAGDGGGGGVPLYIFDSPPAAGAGPSSVPSRGLAGSSSSAQDLVADVELIPAFLRYTLSGLVDGVVQSHPLVLTEPRAPSPQFFLGGPGTGAPSHLHKDAVNSLVYGRKKWFLTPPSRALYSTVPAAEWVANLARVDEAARALGGDDVRRGGRRAPRAGARAGTAGEGGGALPAREEADLYQRLKVCTQEAGDVIYVPHGWGHAVLNVETSVGVAVEFSSALGGG